MIRVVVADDHRIFCDSLATALRGGGEISVTGVAHSTDSALLLVQQARTDVIVADWHLPDAGGLGLCCRLSTLSTRCSCVLLAHDAGADLIPLAVEAGVRGIVPTQEAMDTLITAIRIVFNGGTYLESAGIPQNSPPLHSRLTPREATILSLVAHGYSTKQIAFKLQLSSRTVDHCRQRINDKLGIHEVASLTRYAVRRGLCEL